MFYNENGILIKKGKRKKRLLKRPKRKDLGFKPKETPFSKPKLKAPERNPLVLKKGEREKESFFILYKVFDSWERACEPISTQV